MYHVSLFNNENMRCENGMLMFMLLKQAKQKKAIPPDPSIYSLFYYRQYFNARTEILSFFFLLPGRERIFTEIC